MYFTFAKKKLLFYTHTHTPDIFDSKRLIFYTSYDTPNKKDKTFFYFFILCCLVYFHMISQCCPVFNKTRLCTLNAMVGRIQNYATWGYVCIHCLMIAEKLKVL